MKGILGFYLDKDSGGYDLSEYDSLFMDGCFKLYSTKGNSNEYTEYETEDYYFFLDGNLLLDDLEAFESSIKTLSLNSFLNRDDISKLVGHYAVIVYSKKTNNLQLFVDPYGVGSFVYWENNTGVVFSTFLQKINQIGGASLEINPESIYYYLDFHVIPQPYTIYKSVFKMMPGESIMFKNGAEKQSLLSQLEYTPSADAENNILEKLDKSQSISVSDIVNGLDKKCYGAFLSGGIDSTSVVGALTRTQGEGIKTFSIGFHEKDYDELEFSRIAVDNFGCEEFEYVVEPADLFELIEHIVDSFGEPFGNSSALPVYYCAKLAAENGVNTLIAGDGGDEMFGGNERYLKNKIFDLYRLIPKPVRWLFLESYLKTLNLNNRFYNRIVNFVTRANQNNPERFFNDDSFGSKYKTKLYKKSFLNSLEPDLSLKYLHGIYSSAKADSELNRLLYLDMRLAIASNDLYKVRTMCQSAGVNVRFPMLHPSMINLSLNLKENMKLNGLEKRYIYRKYLRKTVPDEIINKKKKGFGLPISVWLRENEEVKGFFKKTLLSEESVISGFINKEFVEELFNNHQSKQWDNASYLWVLLILELWLKRYKYSF